MLRAFVGTKMEPSTSRTSFPHHPGSHLHKPRRCGKGKQGPGGFFSRSPESRRTAGVCISEFILSLGARGLLWANCGTRCILGWLAELLPSRKSCVAWLLAAARPPQQATQPPQAFTAPLQASFSSQPVKLGLYCLAQKAELSLH